MTAFFDVLIADNKILKVWASKLRSTSRRYSTMFKFRSLCFLVLFSSPALLSIGCNPNQSTLDDAATIKSYKTGFYIPRTKSEYQLVGKREPIAVTAFISRARKLTGDDGLSILADPKITYATTVNGKGEQLLLMVSKEAAPLPIASIESNTLYAWHQQINLNMTNNEIGVTELFVKAPYGKKPIPYTVEQMFVRRLAQNDLGSRESVLVPWLSHVRSETDNIVTFQVGNSILDGRVGSALLEFRQIGSKPIWHVVGRYRDPDVEGGTVFWRPSETEYLSLTRGSKTVTRWRKQDADSVDRVGNMPANSVMIPTVAQEYIDRLPASIDDKNHPRNLPISGFDSWSGDVSVFQLDRNSLTIVAPSMPKLALRLESAGQDEVLMEEDYNPSMQLALGVFWESNKPVVTHSKGDGTDLPGASWTDQNGIKQSGTVLSSRNAYQPGGYFSSGSYEMRYFVHQATSNTVSEVAADGRVIRSGMPVSEFQSRQRTNINIDRMQRDGGVDSRTIQQSNGFSARAQKQMEISQSYLSGDSISELAGSVATDLAIGQVSEQIRYGRTEDGKGIERLITKEVKDFSDGKIHGWQDAGTTFIRGMGMVAVDIGAKRTGDATAQGVWRNTNLSTTASKKIGGAVSETITGMGDMFFKYDELRRNGVFDPTSPDAAFNASVGSARVVGSGVQRLTGVVFTDQLVDKTRGGAAVKKLLADSTGAVFDGTAALSHAIHANTIEKERSQLLENSTQRIRDATAATQSLDALEILHNTQGGVLQGNGASEW